MENAKFTKGPWYRQAISDRIRVLTGTGMAKRVIAVLKDSALPQEQIIGNSYLIAAAPDLYEACKAIRATIVTQAANGDEGARWIKSTRQFGMLDVAIAKAGGNHE